MGKLRVKADIERESEPATGAPLFAVDWKERGRERERAGWNVEGSGPADRSGSVGPLTVEISVAWA